jgi:hypothetical protein
VYFSKITIDVLDSYDSSYNTPDDSKDGTLFSVVGAYQSLLGITIELLLSRYAVLLDQPGAKNNGQNGTDENTCFNIAESWA